MSVLEPYLMFNGNCEEAFRFYKSVFGGEFTSKMKYKDMPEKMKEMKVSESEKEKIMHVSLPIGKNEMLMGGDSTTANPVRMGNNIGLSLTVDNEADAKRIFGALSAGGKVMMPLEKTFYAKLAGMFSDKFGIEWMINYGIEKM